MVIVFPLYLALPLIAPPRAFSATGRLAELLRLDRSVDGAAAAFPSYHVIWAFLAAEALGRSALAKAIVAHLGSSGVGQLRDDGHARDGGRNCRCFCKFRDHPD